MRIAVLLLALTLSPAAAYAQQYGYARELVLPGITAITPLSVELDAHAIRYGNDAYVIRAAEGNAVSFMKESANVDLMQDAVWDSVPPAADTVQLTKADDMRDDSIRTGFQPVPQKRYVFRFHLPQAYAPETLGLATEGASIEFVHVRLGATADTLKDAVVGTPNVRDIRLSGEQGRYFEVTIGIREGILRINQMSLVAPRTTMIFFGAPGSTYQLLYGMPDAPHVPWVTNADLRNIRTASLGNVRNLRLSDLDDFDGIAAEKDNCVSTWNPDQKDDDNDGIGNVCDICPSIPEGPQSDTSAAGAACEDDDRDRVINAKDNCPTEYNPRQEDEDKDGTGNVCDTSDDRWSEQRPWLIYASFAGMVLILSLLGFIIMKRTPAAEHGGE